MYSLGELRAGIRDPEKALRELNRLYHRRLFTREYNRPGVDVFEADWDNLLLLDACRYDVFEAEHDLPGRLESRQSRGSSTLEFLRANFDHRELHDVVYVTANPQLYRHDSISPSLHDTRNVWQEAGWNQEYRTVLPETVADAALETAAEYPNKRLVIHFIQPHYPFIGPTGQEHFDLDSLAFWNEVRSGELSVSRNVLWRAYRENLQVVLPAVRDLLEGLEGRTVVTADHGQAFGERIGPVPLRYYGHPPGVYGDSLVKVPWLVHQEGRRKEVVPERPRQESTVESDVVADRLRDLGYAD